MSGGESEENDFIIHKMDFLTKSINANNTSSFTTNHSISTLEVKSDQIGKIFPEYKFNNQSISMINNDKKTHNDVCLIENPILLSYKEHLESIKEMENRLQGELNGTKIDENEKYIENAINRLGSIISDNRLEILISRLSYSLYWLLVNLTNQPWKVRSGHSCKSSNNILLLLNLVLLRFW